MLRREQFIALGDTLSMCGFTWVLFSQNGEGERPDDGDLLVRTLRAYGIETTRTDLAWFAEAFWAQSMVLKMAHGWTPPTAEDIPARVFEALSQALDFSQDELRALMDRLIVEWKKQASEVLAKYGYDQRI
jgi:aldehyde:ferredoxin oxidoreductase